MGKDEKEHQVDIHLSLDARIDPEGVDPRALASLIQTNFEHAIGNGALTGDLPSTVDEHRMSVIALSAAESRLDEDDIAGWIGDRIDSGNLRLEDIPRMMARYALADPAQMRQEFAERMAGEEADDGEAVEVQATITAADGSTMDFPATTWFEQAGYTDIVALAERGWGGTAGETAGQLATQMEAQLPTVNLAPLMLQAGWTVAVDRESALAWLKTERPDDYALTLCAEFNVRLVEAQEEEISGRWDWIDDQGNASDASLESEWEAAEDAVAALGLADKAPPRREDAEDAGAPPSPRGGG